MKKKLIGIFLFVLVVATVSCSSMKKNDIELMGAGDRIHDSYTFANTGVELGYDGNDIYTISGSVEKLADEKVKEEFSIAGDVDYVVAIKLSANGKEVVKDKVTISVNGVRSYDAEHLNGSDYTFILLEVNVGSSVSINVSWNGEDTKDYVLKFSDNLILK